jgi:hypothetical protein
MGGHLVRPAERSEACAAGAPLKPDVSSRGTRLCLKSLNPFGLTRYHRLSFTQENNAIKSFFTRIFAMTTRMVFV